MTLRPMANLAVSFRDPIAILRMSESGARLNDPTALVQAAARFSTLARSTCPQATGVVIDDFLQQYLGKNSTAGCVNITAASCPATQPHKYGGGGMDGWYCCPTAPSKGGEDCGQPACKTTSDTDCACCLLPGSTLGCQGATQCSSSPHINKTDKPCPTQPMITLDGMGDNNIFTSPICERCHL
jgi:hypothetical protein